MSVTKGTTQTHCKTHQSNSWALKTERLPLGYSWRGIWWQRRDVAASVEGESLAGVGMENETEMCTDMGAWCGNQYPYPRIPLPMLLPTGQVERLKLVVVDSSCREKLA